LYETIYSGTLVTLSGVTDGGKKWQISSVTS